MRTLVFAIFVIVMGTVALAQTPTTTPATATEQARVKPLIDTWKKAQEPFIAKRDALPESKAVKDAQAALAAAQVNLDKALEARAKVEVTLPEFDPVKVAEARLLDELYRILADRKLSSRDFRPTLNDKGELAFVRNDSKP